MKPNRILTLNCGSSSLKFSVHELSEAGERCLLRGKMESQNGVCRRRLDGGTDEILKSANPASAVDLDEMVENVFICLAQQNLDAVDAIGHRIVQGGPGHRGPEPITPSLLGQLRELCPLDPPHLTAALSAIDRTTHRMPQVPQVACFDTSFHRSMPPVAQALPLPNHLTEYTGLLRYGYHGLSCEFIMSELLRIHGEGIARKKIVIAHLGNGASMTAVHDGKSVDTTMGFTPAGGLMMGSRSGDLDPGVIAYLLREGKVAPKQLAEFIFSDCGLKGVSAYSADMRELLEVQEINPLAQKAIDLFCHQARKCLGSLVAILDGLDILIFTGGIGENASLPRVEICRGCGHLGLRIDDQANECHAPIISGPESSVMVRVMKTNEELIIAQHTASLAFSNQSQPCLKSP